MQRKQKGIEVVPVELIHLYDEIFMCATVGGTMPITPMDGQLVIDGKMDQ